MVTGSHNPKDYNGIKMIVGDNPLFDKDIYALRDWIANNTIEEVGNNDKPNISSDIADKYIKRIKEDISINHNYSWYKFNNIIMPYIFLGILSCP